MNHACPVQNGAGSYMPGADLSANVYRWVYPPISMGVRAGLLIKIKNYGRVAELVDAHGLGPCEETLGGSSPLSPTIFHRWLFK